MTDSAVAGYTFFYGSQPMEFEREEVPEVVHKKGARAKVVKRTILAKPSASVYRLAIKAVMK